MQFVEHAVTLSEHGPIYLDVERRGVLGDAEADVLFFNKRSWNLKWIKQFRGQLLQNQQVRSAYDAVPQHTAPQDWVPHLTLGYPETPAKPIPNDGFDHPIYSVSFDRIAVWTGDFEGPEFRLEWPEREIEDGPLALAYSDAQKAAISHYGGVDEAMAHFGVKGMRWGQRKTETVTVKRPLGMGVKQKQVTPKKAAKLDKKFERRSLSVAAFLELHNGAADHVNSNLPALNAKFDKKYPKEMNDGTLWKSDHPVTREYHKAYNDLFTEGLNNSASKMGTSPTGKLRVKVHTKNHESADDFEWKWSVEKVEHAATSAEEEIVFEVLRDDNGLITKVEPMEDSMSQSVVVGEVADVLSHGEAFVNGLVSGSTEMAIGEQFIVEHFGIKGMKWGRRKERPTAVSPKAESFVPHGARRKTKIETDGGENHPAHEDAIRVAKAKATLKKSGPSALSNQELADVANRVRLEQQATELTRSGSKKWIRKFLGNQGNQAANQVVRTEVDSRIRSARAK